MSYALRLTVTGGSFNYDSIEIRIYKKGYTGAATTRVGAPPTLKIAYGDGASSEMSTVVGSTATVSLYSDSRGEFEDMYVTGRHDIYAEMRYTTDPAGMFWRGWLVPEQRDEKITHKPTVTFSFICGLGDLGDLDYAYDNGAPYTGRATIGDILATCLGKIQTGFQIWAHNEIFKSTSTTPNEWYKVDQSLFAGLSCREVLDAILPASRIALMWKTDETTPFWCAISHSYFEDAEPIRGSWWTINPDGTIDSIGIKAMESITIDGKINYFVADPHVSNWSAWDRFNIKAEYGTVENFVDETAWLDPSAMTAVGGTFETYTLLSGEKMLLLNGARERGAAYVEMKAGNVLADPETTLKLSFKYNLLEVTKAVLDATDLGVVYMGLRICDAGGVDHFAMSKPKYPFTLNPLYYISFDGVTTFPYVSTQNGEIYAVAGGFALKTSQAVLESDAENMIQNDMLIEGVPFTGELYIRFYYYQQRQSYTTGGFLGIGETTVEFPDNLKLIIDQPTIRPVEADGAEYPGAQNYSLLNHTRAITTGNDITLKICSLPTTDSNAGNIYRAAITAAGGETISMFRTQKISTPMTYQMLIGYLIMRQHERPATQADIEAAIAGRMPGIFSMISSVEVDKYNMFFASLTYDFEDCIIQGTAVETLSVTAPYAVTEGESESTSGGGGGGRSASGNHPPVTLTPDSAPELVVDKESQLMTLNLTHLVAVCQGGPAGEPINVPPIPAQTMAIWGGFVPIGTQLINWETEI